MPYASPEVNREYQRQWIAARRAAYFADKQCVDCGSTEELELDHKDPSQKIDHKIWSWSAIRRAAEIAKCQVLCRDCHVAKTIRCGERARGVRIAHAKLTPEFAQEIREKFAAGATKRGLGREYGVDEKAIRLLILGQTWSIPGSASRKTATAAVSKTAEA